DGHRAGVRKAHEHEKHDRDERRGPEAEQRSERREEDEHGDREGGAQRETSDVEEMTSHDDHFFPRLREPRPFVPTREPSRSPPDPSAPLLFRRRAATSRRAPFRQRSSDTIASISIRTSRGSRPTWTVARAGGGSPRNRP